MSTLPRDGVIYQISNLLNCMYTVDLYTSVRRHNIIIIIIIVVVVACGWFLNNL